MIKNLTRGRVHKTSLFIQPEYKCNIGCKGCYAVKNEESKFHVAAQTTKIIQGMKDDSIELRQITISLNGLKKKDAGFSKDICDLVSKNIDKDKVHYACAINSIAMYKDLLDFNMCSALNISIDVNKYNKLSEEECAKACDALSFIRRTHKDLHININILTLNDTVDSEDETINDMLEEVVESADSTHLIMNKPIDNLFNFEKLDDFKEEFEKYLISTLGIIETIGDEFHIDACVATVLENLLNNETFTCRAGTDHVSLWPDGKFTGCAYRMPNTEFAIENDSTISFKDYDHIQDVTVSEFDLCLYNKLSILYGSFDELCKNLKLDKNEIKILKSIIK